MRLMADWVLPFQGVLDIRYARKAKCRVRIYEHGEDGESRYGPVVLITDLADNAGEDIASAAEILVGTLLAGLQEKIDLSVRTCPLFINHYPSQTTGAGSDLYELIDFDEPEILELVVEQADSGASPQTTGHRVLWSIGEARFIPADGKLVGALIGGCG